MEEPSISSKDSSYKTWLIELKTKFRQTQSRATVKVSHELLNFYWKLDSEIVERQRETTWGSGFLQRLSHNLMLEFTYIKGFSKRNLERIRKWHLFYNQELTNCDTSLVVIEKTPLISDINKPIGVSEYQLTQSLPETLRSSLPSIIELEEELNQAQT